MKQSEEDANNWKAILCSWNGELILLKYPYYLSNLQISVQSLNKIAMAFFTEIQFKNVY